MASPPPAAAHCSKCREPSVAVPPRRWCVNDAGWDSEGSWASTSQRTIGRMDAGQPSGGHDGRRTRAAARSPWRPLRVPVEPVDHYGQADRPHPPNRLRHSSAQTSPLTRATPAATRSATSWCSRSPCANVGAARSGEGIKPSSVAARAPPEDESTSAVAGMPQAWSGLIWSRVGDPDQPGRVKRRPPRQSGQQRRDRRANRRGHRRDAGLSRWSFAPARATPEAV